MCRKAVFYVYVLYVYTLEHLKKIQHPHVCSFRIMKSCVVLGVSDRLLDLPKISITLNPVNEIVLEQKVIRCHVIITLTLPWNMPGKG